MSRTASSRPATSYDSSIPPDPSSAFSTTNVDLQQQQQQPFAFDDAYQYPASVTAAASFGVSAAAASSSTIPIDPSLGGATASAGAYSNPSDYTPTPHSLSAHESSPGTNLSPSMAQGANYYGNGAEQYAVDDGSARNGGLPSLSRNSASADDDANRFAHQPTSGSFSAGVDGSAASGYASQHQQAAAAATAAEAYSLDPHIMNGAATATMMTPPPPGSSHGGSTAGGSYYQPPSHSAIFHRASISGPVMNHHHYANGSTPGTPHTATGVSSHGAPPQAGDFAAWGTPGGNARPHTADGMFSNHFGAFPTSQWSGTMPDYNRGPRASISSVSSIDSVGPGSSSKTFSYMAARDDSHSTGSGGTGSGGQRKRPRRRYDEIERLYPCSHPGCNKSYGTLNHLNAHVAMQKHGAKRAPGEFKEMRKAWRKAKREEEQRRQASQASANEEAMARAKIGVAYGAAPGMNGYTMGGYGSQVPRYVQGASGMYAAPQTANAYSSDAALRSYSGAPVQSSASGSPAQTSGLGAYLMAHRGSI